MNICMLVYYNRAILMTYDLLTFPSPVLDRLVVGMWPG